VKRRLQLYAKSNLLREDGERQRRKGKNTRTAPGKKRIPPKRWAHVPNGGRGKTGGAGVLEGRGGKKGGNLAVLGGEWAGGRGDRSHRKERREKDRDTAPGRGEKVQSQGDQTNGGGEEEENPPRRIQCAKKLAQRSC